MHTHKHFEELFWPKVNKTETCWPWTSTVNEGGYGIYQRKNQWHLYAHRVSWTITFGDIPQGMCVCHRCDNPPCCNPTHLFLGTRTDNLEDMTRKGRRSRGESVGGKLTAEQVADIRRRYRYGNMQTGSTELAKEFGVRNGYINRIASGQVWGHTLPEGRRDVSRPKITDRFSAEDIAEIKRLYDPTKFHCGASTLAKRFKTTHKTIHMLAKS